MSQTGSDRDLMAEEEQLWTEIHGVIDSLPADEVEEPGYFAEGWTAKDLVAHIGSWLAEAAAGAGIARYSGVDRATPLDAPVSTAHGATATG